MSFSREVPNDDRGDDVFLLRAARSGPVRPFVESELGRGSRWPFAVVVVVVSSSVNGSGLLDGLRRGPRKDGFDNGVRGRELDLGEGAAKRTLVFLLSPSLARERDGIEYRTRRHASRGCPFARPCERDFPLPFVRLAESEIRERTDGRQEKNVRMGTSAVFARDLLGANPADDVT